MAPLSSASGSQTSPPAIAFVGFMGAGKTRAARGAAASLGEQATDVDALIEAEVGEPIESYFSSHGEAAFREVEERLTVAALERGGLVSLGGGAVASERVRTALRDCFVVWCRVDESVAWDRCSDSARPLASDRAAFGRLLADREPVYEQLADAILGDGGERIGRRAGPWLRAASELDGARLAWAASASGDYPAIVGPGAVGLIEVASASAPGGGEGPGRWFAIGDRDALRLHGERLGRLEATIEVSGGEEYKNLAEVERVLRALAAAGARRDDGIVAFGGGVIGDLGGFCAATFQRGIPVVQVPTTLVAQVDSAYGGKTGVDLPEAKNYVGAYHLPRAVLADPAVLATLPPRELAAGFAEVLKTGLIAGGQLWERVRVVDPTDPAALGELVFDCARTKIEVVAADERDGGRRAVLNLGHTVGHAIEVVTGYGRYLHGEAVSLGLLAALRLSEAPELRAEVAGLLRAAGLPTELDPAVSVDDVVAATALDKKATADGVGYVLVSRPGETSFGQRVADEDVRSAVAELIA